MIEPCNLILSIHLFTWIKVCKYNFLKVHFYKKWEDKKKLCNVLIKQFNMENSTATMKSAKVMSHYLYSIQIKNLTFNSNEKIWGCISLC